MANGSSSPRHIEARSIASRLADGPARGLGCANQVAAKALTDASLLRELVEALGDKREVVLIRAANALKKVQAQRPELLAPYAKRILRAALECDLLFARWSLTIVVGALPLRGTDRALAVDLMFEALSSESAILRTLALQALVDLSRGDPKLRVRLRPIAEEFVENGTAAMRARARRLMPLLRGEKSVRN